MREGREYRRGDIYFIHNELCHNQGSEQRNARPGIIVSNNIGNHYSPVVEVVYLTTKKKNPMPTHVPIWSSRVRSTALCEQIHSVDKQKLGDYIGSLCPAERKLLDHALQISLGLPVADVVEKEESGEQKK